ncbi:Asparagine synthase (glutamine-hydrolyzing) [Penicillium ucsense]|uniref:Asparagine synthase (Glutamine-hydrolyzing) n=1 Tax=Penicillium ucsense TaxID=2839758 RepID=A0A8J8VXP9_9EURO|nr:Asparagine synthase (glutamine-hydrolyzing) [Penicillium ucsense]KAF7738365.1 Asparagine synthase (glutamine-hydrolyzing) [Penicillium ucsense]
MCGIFFALSTRSAEPNKETKSLLSHRGPDSCQTHGVSWQSQTHDETVSAPVNLYLTFVSTVLSLRGNHLSKQPLVDPATQSVLCWNGEAWKFGHEQVSGNDTELVFDRLLRAVNAESAQQAIENLAQVIASITGPFAFVFYDARHGRIFFSRDCLGRRSLLHGVDDDGSLKICSLCDGSASTHFQEVGFDGVYMIDLEECRVSPNALIEPCKIHALPWSTNPCPPAGHLKSPIPAMNVSVPEEQPPHLEVETPFVVDLQRRLFDSLTLRIDNVPEPPNFIRGQSAKVAVLFSGGLDCTLLARLAHDRIPVAEPIDLLNVAFENPRVAAAAAATVAKSKSDSATTGMAESISPYEACPDRVTGRSAHAELERTCPGRKWRFIAIDIPYTETIAHRDSVKRLMRPHNTEMDLSIACALYFASRGQGTVADTTPLPYSTTARVLLSGLGADELFAGYGRHGVAFARGGFPELISEMQLDVGRLGQRNLGRDDRVLSHWGRETRFPYLDEDFVAWVLRAPVWNKCGFGLREPEGQGEAERLRGIDKEKMALRLVALRLGLITVAREKKRAIQFGARTAKMEKGRTKGTDALS